MSDATRPGLPGTAAARTTILTALRAAEAPGVPAAPDLSPYLQGPFAGHAAAATDRAALTTRFETAARGWKTEVVRAGDADWPAAVRDALDRHGCRRIVVGAACPLWPRLEAALAGLQVTRFDRPIEEWKPTLFDAIDAGITSVDAALADTGTLLLRPGPAEPRTVSLVPPVHVAVLPASRLHPGLPAALAAVDVPGTLPTNVLLVTGPSRTADIQLTTAYGAHGPKALVVVLVDDAAGSLA